jgi:uncharacterized protein (DUF2147 family)
VKDPAMKKLLIISAIMLAPVVACAADIKGKWLTEEGKGQVLMEDCGGKVCGKIVWLKEPNDKDGKPQADVLNEDPSLRGRPVVGIKLTEMAPEGDVWKGTIYNPEDGKTYKGEVKLQPDGTLLVKGCVLGGILCDDQTWTRVQ